jgi:hypothetical protein
MLNIDKLAPGTPVTFVGDVFLFVAADNGRAILTPDMRANLSAGISGYPAVTGHFTANATGLTHRATVAWPQHLSRA